MKHRYTAMTCRRAARIARPPRPYGYTILIEPPQKFEITGRDVEGIGWVPMSARIHTTHFYGWYKHKSDAEARAIELNK